NDALEKKLLEGRELKAQLEAELQEKLKKMEKEFENSILYNAYTDCQTQLQLEKQKTKRMHQVVDEIVQEVELKAPVFKHQKEEYESMQKSASSLWNKLEQARMVRRFCHLFLKQCFTFRF
ncbi:unnamed protein product, partial [Tetraodon nigroviridis]